MDLESPLCCSQAPLVPLFLFPWWPSSPASLPVFGQQQRPVASSHSLPAALYSTPQRQAKLSDKSLLKNIWELLIHMWSLWKTNSGHALLPVSLLLSSPLCLSFFYLETACWPDWNILSPHEPTAVPGKWSRTASAGLFMAGTRTKGCPPGHHAWDGGNRKNGGDV